MGHLQDFEAELRRRLAKDGVELLVKWLKEKLLESYRNGVSIRAAAGKEGDRFASRYGKK